MLFRQQNDVLGEILWKAADYKATLIKAVIMRLL